jgi:putative MATE family efflux protein
LNRLFGFNDKDFYKLLIKLALPITLQYFISSSLYFVDNIFVGLLGPKEAAAIMAANSIYGVMNVSCFGLVSGCMIFYSQYWGKKDVLGLRRVMGINVIGVLILTATFLIMMQVMPVQLLSLYSKDPEVIGYARQFVSVSSFGYIPNMLAFTFGAVLRSCNKVRLPMISSGIALATNTFLNWVLIFGNLGMPKLGLRGSGIATLISALIDVTIILSVTYRMKLPAAAKPSEMRFDRTLLKKVFARAMPVFVIELFWSIGGVSLFPIFIGAMGTDALAAMSLYTVTDRLSFVLFLGLCNATAVIIGNKIGANEEDKAYLYGKRILALGPVIGIIIAALVIAIRPVVVSIYNYPAAVQNLAMDFMLIAALAVPFIVYNFFMLVGVLRAGGDTRFCMIMDIGTMYLLQIPLVILAVYVFKMPVQLAFAMYFIPEVVKLFFTTPRFRSKKWIINLVRPEAGAQVKLNTGIDDSTGS